MLHQPVHPPQPTPYAQFVIRQEMTSNSGELLLVLAISVRDTTSEPFYMYGVDQCCAHFYLLSQGHEIEIANGRDSCDGS